MVEEFTREEEVLVEESHKPTWRVSDKGDFVYHDRHEACIKGAQDEYDLLSSTQMVPREA